MRADAKVGQEQQASDIEKGRWAGREKVRQVVEGGDADVRVTHVEDAVAVDTPVTGLRAAMVFEDCGAVGGAVPDEVCFDDVSRELRVRPRLVRAHAQHGLRVLAFAGPGIFGALGVREGEAVVHAEAGAAA